MQYQKLSLVMPAYNEEKTLASIVKKVVSVDWKSVGLKEIELVIVNDASKDGTGELLTKLANQYTQIKPLTNEVNLGKSRSVKRAILESSGDLVVIQDADKEYDPHDLLPFVELFQTDHKLEVVYGNRFHPARKVRNLHYIGNLLITVTSNIFTSWRGLMVPDMEVCYKMATGKLFRKLAAHLRSTSNFGFEPEITALFAKNKVKLAILPISYYPRTPEQGKHLKPIKDGYKAVKEVIFFNIWS